MKTQNTNFALLDGDTANSTNAGTEEDDSIHSSVLISVVAFVLFG